MINLIFPITSDNVQNKEFFDETKKRKDVKFLVGVTEENAQNYKTSNRIKNVKVIVFQKGSKKEEMINSLKEYALDGSLFIVRSPISQKEIDKFLQSKADITTCSKKRRGSVGQFFDSLCEKLIKIMFGFSPYKGDVTAVRFSEGPSEILKEGYNISYATRVDRWKGYSHSTVDIETPKVKLEYNKLNVALMLGIWLFLLLGAIAGVCVYFVFVPATFLNVFVSICILFLLLTAVFISVIVALLKMNAGERYYGKAKEIKKEKKNEKN